MRWLLSYKKVNQRVSRVESVRYCVRTQYGRWNDDGDVDDDGRGGAFLVLAFGRGWSSLGSQLVTKHDSKKDECLQK